MKIIIFLLYTTYNCLLYSFTTVYVCNCSFLSSIFATFLFIFAATVNIRWWEKYYTVHWSRRGLVCSVSS